MAGPPRGDRANSLAKCAGARHTLRQETRRATTMAFKPNYNQQRAERDRAKQAKKEAKLRERQEAAQNRKAGDEPASASADAPPDEQETPS
jgi:hypothetical protein